MKNRLPNIGLLFFLLAFTACNKITESIQQDIIITDTVYFTIPPLPLTPNLTTIPEIPSNFDLEKQVNNSINNFNMNQVTATKITKMIMVLKPILGDSIDAKNNFNNLENIKFRIVTDQNANDIANKNTPLTTNRSTLLDPIIEPEFLKLLLVRPSFTYSAIVKAKTVTTASMEVAAVATYTITLSK